MAFQLKANESVGDGITRNVRRQIEKALQHLRAAATHQRGAAQNEAVREVRKCFKKVRAALRLVREELGDEAYHEENWFFRDAARRSPNSAMRRCWLKSWISLRSHSPRRLSLKPSQRFMRPCSPINGR